jgi:hypothetical protein
VTLYALQDGHAEELLGAVLCVTAVLAAQRGRAGWSGILLGLAIANKQWALLAIGPVLVALPAHRVRAAVIAGALAACFYFPLWLASHIGGGSASPGALALAGSGAIFQPWQLWWFLGSHAQTVRDGFGVAKFGYRSPPAWIQSVDHPLIVALAVPATALAVLRRRTDAMLLLAFLLAIRFTFDTWDTVYYPLPFIFALLAWESLDRRRPPVLALAASVVVWLVFIVVPEHVSPDAQAAVFLVAAVPALLALAIATFAPGAWSRRVARWPRDRRSSAPKAAPIPGL